MQLQELSAGVGHVVHLQVRGGAEDPGDHAGGQGEPGGVHEVEQQRDAGRVQGVREGHGAEVLAAAAATALEQHAVGVQRVEEPAGDGGECLDTRRGPMGKLCGFGLACRPAGHEHGAVGTQLGAAHHQGGVRQDAAAPELVQVEQHVAGVARELLHVPHDRLHLWGSARPVRLQLIHRWGLSRRGQAGRGGA